MSTVRFASSAAFKSLCHVERRTQGQTSSANPTTNEDGSQLGHVVLGVLGGLSLATLVVVITVPLMRWRWRKQLAREGRSDIESSRAGSRRTHTRIISTQDASLPLLMEQTQAGAAPEMVTVAMVDGLTAPIQQQQMPSTWQWKILTKLPSFSSDSLSSLGQPLDKSAKKWNAEEELDAFFREREKSKEMGGTEGVTVTMTSASQTSLPAHNRAPPIITQDASSRRSRVDSEKGPASSRATPTASETLHSSDYTPASARPSRTSTLLGAASSPLLPTPVLSLSPLDESFSDLELHPDNKPGSVTSSSSPKARSRISSEKAHTLPVAGPSRASAVLPPTDLSRSASTPRPNEMKWISNVLASTFFTTKASRNAREQPSRKPPNRMPSIPESLRPSQLSQSPVATSSKAHVRDSSIPQISEFGEYSRPTHASQQNSTRNSSEYSRRPMSDATIATFGRQPTSPSAVSFQRAASGASSTYPPDLQAHYRNRSNTTGSASTSAKRSQSGSDSKSGSRRGRRSNEASESSQSQGSNNGAASRPSKSRRVSYAREPSPPLPTMPLSIPPQLRPPLPPKPESSAGHESREGDGAGNDAELSVPQLPLRPISPFTFDEFSFRVTPPESTHGHSKSRSASTRSNASRRPSRGRATPPLLSTMPVPDDSIPLLGGMDSPPWDAGHQETDVPTS